MSSAKKSIQHDPMVSKKSRRELLAQHSGIVWFTGLSGSGKSTIAGLVEKKLNERGFLTYLLDGDGFRSRLNSDLGFSDADRNENIRRAGEVARMFVDAGVIVLASFISPFKADRQMVRELMERGEFTEVYVNCPLEVCEMRDPKGLYKKARAGEIPDFTGIHSAYEAPDRPDIEIRSDVESAEEAAEKIVRLIKPRLELD